MVFLGPLDEGPELGTYSVDELEGPLTGENENSALCRQLAHTCQHALQVPRQRGSQPSRAGSPWEVQWVAGSPDCTSPLQFLSTPSVDVILSQHQKAGCDGRPVIPALGGLERGGSLQVYGQPGCRVSPYPVSEHNRAEPSQWPLHLLCRCLQTQVSITSQNLSQNCMCYRCPPLPKSSQDLCFYFKSASGSELKQPCYCFYLP